MRRICTRIIALLALLLVLNLTGCDESWCRQLSACDIRDGDCQQLVLDAMTCIRRSDAIDKPHIEVLTPEEFIERLRYDDEGDDDEATDAEQEQLFDRTNRALVLLEMSPEDYDADQALEEVSGELTAAYLRRDQSIIVIDRGGPLDDRVAVLTLAHEVVHALQDAEIGLDSLRDRIPDHYDASLALKAVIEGDAVTHQLLALAQLDGIDVADIDWAPMFRTWKTQTLWDAEEDDAPVWMARVRFPYAFGGSYVLQHWLARGRRGVDALFDEPPTSTHEILFGTDRTEIASARNSLESSAIPDLMHLERVGYDRLGAWIARMFAARTHRTGRERTEAAEAAATDVLSIHRDPETDGIAVAWRVRSMMQQNVASWRGTSATTYGYDYTRNEGFALAAEEGVELAPSERIAWLPVPEGEDDANDAGMTAQGLLPDLWLPAARRCGCGHATAALLTHLTKHR